MGRIETWTTSSVTFDQFSFSSTDCFSSLRHPPSKYCMRLRFLYDSTTIHDVRVALVQYRNLPAHLHPTFICGLYCLSSRVQARASQGKLVRWTRCCMICSACSHSIFLSAQLCKTWRGCCCGEMAWFALKSSCSTGFC